MCVVDVVVIISLALALVLPTRVTAAAENGFLTFLIVRAGGTVFSTVSDHACLPTAVCLTVVTELSEVRVQAALASMKRCIHYSSECLSCSQFKQCPRCSRGVAERPIGAICRLTWYGRWPG